MPTILYKMAMEPRGLILVTGPTGSGKSTTLAAMIEHMNQNSDRHIITIEDPIEYVYESKQSLIHQREVGEDITDFASAIRSALREDPDVILVGEMRDYETISTALLAAETGHLVLSTLHTTGAAQTVERIVELIHCSRRIELYAVGSSRMPGSELAKRLQTIGKAAFCYDDSTLMNISARQLTSDDLVLALSISGETSLIIAAATVAKSRGAALVSFTNLGSNTLSGMADENLYVNATNFVCSGIQVRSRVQLLMLCEYLFFRYIETYGDEHQQSIG